MPAPQSQEARRGKLLQGLFWGGVGLAPLAILILLFGQSTGALRVAVTLSVLTIVMLAVSIALRPSVEMVRVDIEHRVLDEMERMRLRAREDITTAARNTHRVLTDKINVLAESVEDLRGQVDEAGAILAQGSGSPVAIGGTPGAPGVVRRTETVHVTRRTTTVGGGDDEGHTGTVYGSKTAVPGEWRERPAEPAEDRERRWDGMAAGDRWASVRADDDGRELRVGERRSSVRNDGRGTEFRVEDRWAALRRDEPRRSDEYGEADWDSTFRSLSSRPAPALPAAPGESPDRYVDEGTRRYREDDRRREGERYRDGDRRDDRFERDRRDQEPIRSRGRERERYEREREHDRGRDGRGYDDRGRDDRGHDDRGYDRDRDHDRGYDRDRDRGYERERDDRPRGSDRDRGYDRDDRPRDSDRGYDRDRGSDRGYDLPRPRSPHPSEYDR